jgi:hypothetical protein
MTVSLRGTNGTQDSSAYTVITQGPSTMTISAFRIGDFDGSHSFSTQAYGVAEILNTASLKNFAIGDGAIKYSASFTGDSAVTSQTVAWTGDDQARLSPATDSAYYSDANGGTLPTTSSQTVAFAGSEVWDCSAGTSSFTSIPDEAFTSDVQTQLQACDDKYEADSDRTFTDCRSGDD